MKRLLALSTMLMLMAGPGCGGDTHESLAAEVVPVMREMADTISTIKDEATAKAAKPKLERIAAKMKDLNTRREKLPAPTEAQTKAMIEKYGKEMEAAQRKMMGSLMAISGDPKIQEVLKDIDFKM